MSEQTDQQNFPFVLTTDGYHVVFGAGPEGRLKSYALPTLKVFNSSGVLISNIMGYSGSFPDKLANALENVAPASEDHAAADEISHIKTADGHDFDSSKVGENDFVFLGYGADWCTPCVAQTKDVKEFIKKRNDLKIMFLKIEADISKLESETQVALIGTEFPTP